MPIPPQQGVIVGTTNPHDDEHCDESPGALGTTNLGGGSPQNGWGTTVIDIFGLKPSPTSIEAYGWVYITGNGSIFIQYNPDVGGGAFSKWLGKSLGGVPFAGPLIDASIEAIADTAGNPTQITAADWAAIQQGIRDHASYGDTLSECFKKPLPESGAAIEHHKMHRPPSAH